MDLSGKNGAVVSSSPLAAEAGADILKRGGNAIDAAVGAMLAECVVQPHNVGLGGYGGAMVIYLARERRTTSINFDSVAPLAAAPDMFRPDPDAVSGESGMLPVVGRVNEYGYMAVTVPAVVSGLAFALRKYGSMSWADASLPARKLAREGFPASPDFAAAFARFAELADAASTKALFGDRGAPAEGELFTQPDLADLLDKLADEGPEAFYGPEIAGHIAKHVAEHGGMLQPEDFGRCWPIESEPLTVRCGDDTLCTPELPSGGGTALEIVLAMHQLGVSESDYRSGRFHHFLAEVMKRAWTERLQLMGDPLFSEDPTPRLLSQEHIREIISSIPEALPTDVPIGAPSADQHTAHTVAADNERNMVSLTATQGAHFGARVVIEGLGLVMGNGMSRFDPIPGRPNSIQPGKRMLHNMSPILILRNGEGRCVFGLPGGRKIVNVGAQLGIGFVEFGMTPARAIDAPRIHTEGAEPILLSPEFPTSIAEALESRGHTLRPSEVQLGGPASAIAIDPDTGDLLAASQRGEKPVQVI